jgi:hypothetical protein
MICDKYILQLFLEDENYAMSLLIISNQFINLLTFSPPKRHPVCAGDLLPNKFFLDILTLEDGTDLLSQNIGM